MRVLITGGAGFIGCNTAVDFIGRGDEVVIFDNLSRAGTEENLAWVRAQPGQVNFVRGDVRDAAAVLAAMRSRPEVVIHLAAQVAVTSSVEDPRTDFDVNALGTLNVLEALRVAAPEAVLLFASTNKVYGALEEVACTPQGRRYVCELSATGVDEDRPLDFHSPYGCSKGAADQYVRDYARIYGLRTVVLRQSCIYGNRQFGIEEQGWLAWFTLAALMGRTITVYGDGMQVRDVLEISDLVRLYRLCVERIDRVGGRILNVGGGPDNAVSILESLDLLGETLGVRIEPGSADWRPGDQKIFISCNREAERLLGWRPTVTVREGLGRLVDWIRPNLEMIRTKVG
jgi:CDP-paratose 2-epimerase